MTRSSATRLACALFLLTALPCAALRPWGERYRVVLWCGPRTESARAAPGAFAAACRELGVTTLMTAPEGDPAPWLAAGFDYYVENLVSPGLCLKFRSSVTDWDAFVTAWSRSRSPDAFRRDYGLADPAWLETARRATAAAAGRHARFAPVLYDLRDELSVTVSANPFD
jgi:hypothetical protein